MNNSKTVNEYILAFPKNVQERLLQIRAEIKRQIPDIEETIAWKMPAFKLKNGKTLIFVAAYKNHIGIYPMVAVIAAFEKELANFKLSKGTIQIQHNQPFSIDLIKKIIAFRIAEISEKPAC
ncbi:MAG: DUF1801 domain-containing protein [Dysgonamonadaceae bacterium]|jgi:uncharacterized protein YdhG (YjbR/CyaY superfamily)|nr:DUF1801 domain-containing protein [Dysgonamonadaceae bacterium]